MLTSVAAVRDTEPKIKVEVLQEAVLKVVPFNHPEIIHRAITYSELHAKRESGRMREAEKERYRERKVIQRSEIQREISITNFHQT